MTRRERQRRTLALLLAALVLIAAAIAAVLLWPQGGTAEKDKLFSFDPAKIERFSVASSLGDTSFIRTDTGWVCREQPDFPLDGEYVDALLQAMTGIAAERRFTDGQTAELDRGDVTVTVTAEAGEESYVFTAYRQNPQTLLYYASAGDGLCAVTNTAVEQFLFRLYALADLENPDILLPADIVSLTVSLPDGSACELFYEADGRPSIDYTGTATWFYRGGDGTLHPADSLAATEVLDAVQSLSNEALATANATPAQLEDYGLTDRCITVTLRYRKDDAEYTTVRRISTEQSGDYVTAYTEGSRNVYFADRAQMATLLEKATADLGRHEVLGIELAQVTGFTVRYGGRSCSYTLAVSGEDEQRTYTLRRGEETVAATDFVALFHSLAAIEPQAQAADAGGAELFSIAFSTTNTAFGEVTLTVRQYDDSFYVSTLAGDTPLLLNRRTVNALLSSVEKLVP